MGLRVDRRPVARVLRPVASRRPVSWHDDGMGGPGSVVLQRLTRSLAKYAPHDGTFQLPVPGTYAIRLSHPPTEAAYATLGPSLCIVAQGAKAMMLGGEVFKYDPKHFLVFAVDLPVSGQVLCASAKEPYLGFILRLDAARLTELAGRVFPAGVPKVADTRGLYVGNSTDGLVDAVARLVELMADPGEAHLIGPVIVDEILLRLLRTSIGARLAQLGRPKSDVKRIGAAVSWIREHFAQPITVEAMAASAHMKASTFHQRFKAVTSMSPLQYQKVLRLHEARRLMLFQKLGPTDACHRVGYLSASQFTREYSRFFGQPPTRDLVALREMSGPPVERV